MPIGNITCNLSRTSLYVGLISENTARRRRLAMN